MLSHCLCWMSLICNAGYWIWTHGNSFLSMLFRKCSWEAHAMSFPWGPGCHSHLGGWLNILYLEQGAAKALLTWWASAKLPRRIQDASSDSGGENIMGRNELCGCGCDRLSSSLRPDTALKLPSVGTQGQEGQGHKRNWGKTKWLLPPTTHLPSQNPSLKGSWCFLQWSVNLCYHHRILNIYTTNHFCWAITFLSADEFLNWEWNKVVPFPSWNLSGHLQHHFS